MKMVGRVIEILVGLTFLWAGFLKILDPKAFLSSILTYDVFNYTLSVVASLVVPYLEMCIGVGLVLQVLKGGARFLATLILLVFIALLVQAALRGLDVDCGCFGLTEKSSESGFAWPIARDALMIAGLAIAFVCERFSQSDRN